MNFGHDMYDIYYIVDFFLWLHVTATAFIVKTVTPEACLREARAESPTRKQ